MLLFKNLSRAKPAISSGNTQRQNGRGNSASGNIANFEEFLTKRDYTGALTLLEVRVIIFRVVMVYHNCYSSNNFNNQILILTCGWLIAHFIMEIIKGQ